MNNLFSDDENAGSCSNPQLTINEHYAKAFEYRKEREELERRKRFYIYPSHSCSLISCFTSKSQIRV